MALLLGSLLITTAPASAQQIKLSMPVDCVIGKNCFIQQYPDVAPGPDAKDYRCGSAVYNKHKGTDIRVRSVADVARGVNVLAAAPGTVLRARNNVPDRIVSSAVDREVIQDVLCGNGLVIDHGGGWETQYCHLLSGSLIVKPGQRVERGQPLGRMGFSGLAQFPHLHLAVRRNGVTIDPFTSRDISKGCNRPGAKSLWDAAAASQLKYREGRLLSGGFSAKPVKPLDVLKELPDERAIASNSPALVAYGWWINLKKGDRIVTRLTGPAGKIADEIGKPLNRNKANWVQFAGARRPPGGWPAGIYTARVAVIRDGRAILGRKTTFDMR